MNHPTNNPHSYSIALLPCRCGGKARFQVVKGDAYHDVNVGGHYIDCEGCGLSTKLVFPRKDDVSRELAKRELAEKWNKRGSGPNSYSNAEVEALSLELSQARQDMEAMAARIFNLEKALERGSGPLDEFSRLSTLIEDIKINRYGKPLIAALHLCNDLAEELYRATGDER